MRGRLDAFQGVNLAVRSPPNKTIRNFLVSALVSFKHVVTVGAGVLGLAVASVLQDKYPGLHMTIVAAEISIDTTCG
jgi:hypothetical protein